MAQITCNLTHSLPSCRLQPAASASRSGFFQGTPVPTLCRQPVQAQRAAGCTIEARYRGKGTDLTKVDNFKRHTTDVGSTEVQIARISARVSQLTSHLKEHRKDFAATRGLVILLGQRRRLMTYLYKQNRSKYEQLLKELGIRPLKVQAGRGVVVKLTVGSEVEVMSSTDAAAATV